jgi:3-hydroxy-D-aspartate aldolase
LAIEYGSGESALRKSMNPRPAEIGVPVAEVETPALIIDLDALDRNIAKMAEFARVPTADRVIVDAGLKSYSAERGPPWVHDRPDVEVTGVSDEHGKLKVGAHARPLSLGEQVWLIPGHCDPTVNLHDWYVGVRKDRVEALWPISARGASI